MSISKSNKKQNQYLSANKVIAFRLIPWIKSLPTLTGLIKRKIKKNEKLPFAVIVRGKGRRIRFFIEKNSIEKMVKDAKKNRQI